MPGKLHPPGIASDALPIAAAISNPSLRRAVTGSSIRALLIDDESPARDDLRRLLAPHAGVIVTGEAGTLEEARTLFSQPGYDLVFLDVHLVGGSGFDLVPDIRPDARVVFVSGYERYALRAFGVNALDYLLKPVDPVRLNDTLRRLGCGDRGGKRLDWDDATLVKTNTDVARSIRVRDIVVIFSSENYAELLFTDASRIFVRRTMKAWDDLLPAGDFMRVHRTAIVNLHAIRRVVHRDRETTELIVTGLGTDHPVRARRTLWPQIEQRLAAIRH